MRNTLRTLGFALAVSMLACESDRPTQVQAPPPPKAATSGPEALIARLYARHDNNQSPFFQSTDRARVDEYFERTLADLIWNDSVHSVDEVGAFDFDPLYDAQDTEIRNFRILPATIEAGTARVLVTFMNLDVRTEIVYSLEQKDGAWKITDITWADARSLRNLLTAQ